MKPSFGLTFVSRYQALGLTYWCVVQMAYAWAAIQPSTPDGGIPRASIGLTV